MTWFPHEPIDAVTYCILYRRASKLGEHWIQGAMQNGTKDASTNSREQSEMEDAFQKNRWLPLLEAQIQENL